MEEKERYEYFFGTNTIKDNKTNQFYGCVVDLLNQQDKRIKELNRLLNENQQLKQQIEEYKTYKDWQDMLCCKSAQEVIDFVMSNYLTEDEKCRTIADLKHLLEVAEKALDKMSEYAINDNDLYDLVSDFNIENGRYDEDHFGIDTCDVVDYFKLKADKELKGE